MSYATHRAEQWDAAMLALLVERQVAGLDIHGEQLLVAVIEEANNSMARLREHGHVIDPVDEED